MRNVLTFEQDMNKEVRIRQINGSLFEDDADGTQINVLCYRNGQPENLTGTIIGEIIRSDGTLVIQNGTANGNSAGITIPEAALLPGVIKIYIRNFIVGNGEKGTLLAISGVVVMNSGTYYIDPGSIVPSQAELTSLINSLSTKVATIQQYSIEATQITADDFSINVVLES